MGPDREENGKVGTLEGKYETEEQSASGKVPAKGQSAGPRPWLFRITAATIIPVALLILVELCLRIIGFGYPTSAIIERDIAGQQVCINNLKFGWRFFPKQIARETHAFVFPVVKPSQTYRIFVLGGSAAMGTPEPAYGLSRTLQVLLDNKYRDLKFEVINVAMAAINSHGVLEMAKDCARYKPDLFIVYLGNNEVTGPYGAGTVYAPFSPSLSIIRASIAIKSTKLGQLLEDFLTSFTSKQRSHLKWVGLRMHLDKQVRFDSRGLKYVYKHFKKNLTDICKIGAEVGAEVIVCNVATSLKDCPPFASLHKPELTQADKARWHNIYNQAIQLESEGKYTEALQHYQSAIDIDEQFAETYFRMGRCYWAMEKYDQAKDSFIKARNLDTLRFRADGKINEIIHRVANKAENQVTFVDAVEACQKASPYGTPGKELFYEHVHFNFKGTYLLARTILERVEKAVWEQRGVKTTPGSTILGEEDCAARLAFTGWDHLAAIRMVFDGFIKKPPFTNQAYHDELVKEMTERIEALMHYTQPSALQEADDQYRQALKWYPSDWYLRWKYGQFLREALGENEAAISQLALVLQQLPHCYVYNELSVLLYKQGRTDEGIKMARQSLKMKPLEPSAHCNLALGLDKKGQLKTAIRHYSKALEIGPELSADAYRLLATALHNYGRNNKAIEVLRDGIKIFPDSADLHCGLGVFLKEQGKISEAINEFRITLRIQPNHLLARKALMETGS